MALTAFDEFVLDYALYAQLAAILGLYLWLGLALYQQKIERDAYLLTQTEVGEEELEERGFAGRVRRDDGMVTEWDLLSMEEKWWYRNLSRLLNMWSVIPGVMVLAGGFVWFHAETELGWTGLAYGWARALIVILLLGFVYYGLSYFLFRARVRQMAREAEEDR